MSIFLYKLLITSVNMIIYILYQVEKSFIIIKYFIILEFF